MGATSPGRATGRGLGRRAPGRLLLPTDRADLRVSWHDADDGFVLSLWHGEQCVGSAPLTAADAAELASFLVVRLGARGRWTPRLVGEDPPGGSDAPDAGSAGLTARLARLRRRLLDG
jgi:hypothetical protein